ncbi:MAG: M48 family metalloprotease [Pseudomonadota bacterium]
MRAVVFLFAIFGLVACTEPTPDTQRPGASQIGFLRSTQAGIDNYFRVAGRVRPVAVQVCRQIHASRPASFCDFQVKVIRNPNQSPNAFQSIGRDGRPVISFNVNLLRTVRNDDELAFIFGHEAGHQIARHLEQTRQNQISGAILVGILVATAGGDASLGADIGAEIGGRSYSKAFELEADTIGVHVADRAGYNVRVGVRTFDKQTGSSALLATHPPSSERRARVERTIRQIEAAKRSGRRAAITW